MASDVNVVVLVGRLTRDCTLRYTQNGSPIISFTVAVNRAKRNADGSWSDEASFVDCTYFNQNAQNLSQFLTKGRQVAISGELRQSKWEGQDGQSRSKLEVIVNTLNLLSQPNQGQGGGFASQYSQRPQQNQGYQAPRPAQSEMSQPEPPVSGPESFEDDSIPF